MGDCLAKGLNPRRGVIHDLLITGKDNLGTVMSQSALHLTIDLTLSCGLLKAAETAVMFKMRTTTAHK